MGQRNFMRKCKVCERSTMHIQEKPNHVLHLLLTVFTVGLWLIPWLLIGMSGKAPQCTSCGRTVGMFG